MSLEASTLSIVVKGDGIMEQTEALNKLAVAGDKAEKSTSKIGSGAAASAKAQVDAAQQAASGYNAIIDMMTEKSSTFYTDKAMKAAQSAQQELFAGMSMMDKLYAYGQDMAQKEAVQRAQQTANVIAQQQAQYDAAVAASEKTLAQQYDAYQKQKAMEAQAQGKGDALNLAGQRAADYKKIQDAAKALADETKRLDAAQKALDNDHGKAILEDKARAWKALSQAQVEASAINAKMDRDAKTLKEDGDAFVASLKRQAEAVGMTAKELKEYNAEQLRTKAAQLGVSQQVEQHIQTLQKAKGPHESFNLLTAGSTRELLVLGHELSQGSFQRFGGSLIVLAERVNFLPSLLEKAGAAAASMGVGVGVLVAGVLAIVGAVVAVATAFAKGASEQRAFNNALILTGNFAGTTGDNLNLMARNIGTSVGSIGEAKKVVLELASSGKFTAEQIGFIAPAITEVAHITGQSTEKMVKDFEGLATLAVSSSKRSTDVISQHVLKLSDDYHFLTASQFAHISSLEKHGEAQQAVNEAEQAYADKLMERSKEIEKNLGTIQTAWMHIKETAGEAWDAMLGIGKKATPQDMIEKYKSMIEHMDSQPKWISGDGQGGNMQKNFDESRLRIVKALTDAVIEKNNADATAIQQGKDQQAQQAGMHAMARTAYVENQVSKQSALERALAEQKVNDTLAQQAIAIDKRSKDPNVVAASIEAEKKYTEEAITNRNKLITEYYTKKTPKPKSEGMSGLDEEIAKITEKYEVEKRGYDNKIKLIDLSKQYGLMADSEAEKEKSALLDKELVANKERLEKELNAVDNFHTKDVRLANEAAKKRLDIEKQLTILKENIQFKKDSTAMLPDARSQKFEDAADAASQALVTQTAAQTQAIQFKINAYNKLSDTAKQAGVTEKQMQDEITQAQIDGYDAKMKTAADLGPASAKEIQRLKNEKAALVDKTAAQKELEKIQTKNSAALNQSSALTKIATEQVKIWKNTGNEIEKALKSAFGNSGEAAGKMFKAFAENQAEQIELANQIRVVNENKSLDEATKTKQLTVLQDQMAQAQIGSYGAMADAAAGFFDKQSAGYKVATSVSKAFHLAEVALALASIPAKLAAGAATMFAQSGWGAFAGIAAMTAAVAAFGVSVTSSSGGMSVKDKQSIQGTGTVLGSPTVTDGNKVVLVGAKSDSIAHSLTILEKNSGLGLVVQNDMLTAMKTLNDNITAFATLVVQNSGLTGATAPNSKSFSGTGVSVAGTAGGALGGAVLGTYLGMGMAAIGGPLGLAIGAALGAVLGHGIVGKALSAVFGGSTSVTDTGLSVKAATLSQVAANGLNASQYTDTKTSGGLFRSDKNNTALSSLGADTNDQFTKVILSMSDTLKAAAKTFGVDGDAFNAKLQSFVVDIGQVSLKGMSSDEITKTLQNIFSKLGDQMAQFAFSDLTKYQKIGEGLMETVTRVANDLIQVRDVFAVLSKTIPQGVAAIAASEQLISKFGTVDDLTKGVKAYMSAIYTDQQKLDPVIKSVSAAMAGLGLSSVTSKAQFKNVVDGIDLTTSAGADLFAKLMQIAPAFGQVADAADEVIKKAAEGLLSEVDNAFSALTSVVNREKDKINKAAEEAKAAAQKQLDAAKGSKEAIQKVFDSLTNALKSTEIESVALTKARRMEAQSYLALAAIQAKSGGDVTKLPGLDKALDAIAKPSEDMFSTFEDYARDQALAANSIESLQGTAKSQLDYAQLTIDKLDATIKAIDDQKDADIARLDKILSDAQEQINVLKGQSTTLLSIDAAIKSLSLAILQASNNPLVSGTSAINQAYQTSLGRNPDAAGLDYWKNLIGKGTPITDIVGSIGNSSEAKIQALYKQLLGRSADAGGLDYWTKALNGGASLDTVEKAIKSGSEYSSMPHFDKGINEIPYDMIAKVHKGERIVPAADNSEIKRRLSESSNSGSASNDEVIAKLDELIVAINSGDASNIQQTREVVKYLKKFDQEGLPETRDVTA